MRNELSIGQRLSDVVAQYEQKKENLRLALDDFNAAGVALRSSCTIAGEYGRENINTGSIHIQTLESSLLKSAWYHIYDKMQISYLASADDKKRFEQSMISPPEFNMDNIRATFGDYILDPRGNILRGLAEVFCSLDPAYKSHEKVKFGVKGLPKRVIISRVSGVMSYGRDQIINIVNAIAAYQGKPLASYREINEMIKGNGDIVRFGGELPPHRHGDEPESIVARGVWLKTFQNGNGHLFFDKQELLDINRALAEYYGDVLPDASEEKPTEKRQSTAVSKDLQYYPTPRKVVDRIVSDLHDIKGKRVLEPSCGCGRFMDALKKAGADVYGFEYDSRRAQECRSKGHKVLTANFLETIPTNDFDYVVMNPPFYGKHYAKHVNHALKFLKKGGVLKSILPATARYDHGLLEGDWHDLPVGSFKESGTNISTTVLTIRNK